jgi:hypothetical protein
MRVTGKLLRRWLGGCLAALVLLSTLAVGGSAQAAILEETLTAAGKSYLSSVLKDYAKESQDGYGSSIKQAQKLINGLAEQLEKAADPEVKASDRAAIFTKVNGSKAALADLASSFTTLAKDTETFDQQLQTSLEDLLKLVKGDVRTQLTQNEDTYRQIASTLSALATSAGKIDENNLSDLLDGVGDNITTLNTAFDLGNKALKSVASLAQ